MVANGLIYAMGGYFGNFSWTGSAALASQVFQATLASYNPTANAWTQLSSAPHSHSDGYFLVQASARGGGSAPEGKKPKPKGLNVF